MKRILILFLLSSVSALNAVSQSDENQNPNKPEKYIHLEAGFISPQSTIKESVPIRQNMSYYYVNQYSDGYVTSTTNGFVFGARYEYFLPKLKSGISTGLRYTGLMTDISGYTSGTSEFFYLRYTMDENDTRFARVKSLKESHHFITIPFEITVIPVHIRNTSFYARAGIEYSLISLKQEKDVNFQDDNMNTYKNEVLGNISGAANKNYSSFYSSIGFKLGKENRPNYNFEILLPSFLLTGNNFAFVDADYFSGFRLSVQFKVKNNK